MTPLHRFCLVLFLGTVFPGSVFAAPPATVGATPPEEEAENDPFERFNRAMFAFNEKFDAWLLKPTAQFYDAVFPRPVKTGVSNFFSNLGQPAVAMNDLLQGKVEQGADDISRFLLNSSFGVLGVFDLASDLGNGPREEDFGQTLAVWGVGPGPYFVWPIIGPRYARDTVGWGLDYVIDPVYSINDKTRRWTATGVELVDTRRQLLPSEKVLEAAAGEDKYLFVREAYRQRRQYLIYDGHPPRPEFFEEEPPANNNAKPR